MLDGVTAVVVGGDSAAHREVAAGLTDRGARVTVTTELTDDDDDTVDLLVWLRTPDGTSTSQSLAATDPHTWAAVAEQPLHDLLRFLQSGRPRLRAGGRVVVVVPSFALTGSPGRTAWATAAEGQRTFVKLAARAWGGAGITVNCIAADGHLLIDDTGDVNRPGLPAAALPEPPTLREHVAGAIASVAHHDAGGITGQTIAVDAGVWMQP